jgi:hypothetical protein
MTLTASRVTGEGVRLMSLSMSDESGVIAHSVCSIGQTFAEDVPIADLWTTDHRTRAPRVL